MATSVHMTWPQYLRRECTLRVDGLSWVVKLQPQCAQLLSLLLMRKGLMTTRYLMRDFLWPLPDDEPEDYDNTIKVRISTLRKILNGVATIKNVSHNQGMYGNKQYTEDRCNGGYYLEEVA